MVMPEEGGKAGEVTVTLSDGREEVLRGDYAGMTVAGEKQETYVADQAKMEETFGTAIAALPKPPLSATLYFVSGKEELTAASKADAEKFASEFQDRKAPEVWIIGHTDTVGTHAYNEALAMRRAEKVRQMLIKLGVPPENIVAKGMGKREPRVPTPDNTDEPRNRRVEISVR